MNIRDSISLARRWYQQRARQCEEPADGYVIVWARAIIGTTANLLRPEQWVLGSYAVPVLGGPVYVRSMVAQSHAWLEMRGSVSIAPDLRLPEVAT